MSGLGADRTHSSTSPLPPAELRLRVAGTDDSEWFDKSGEMHVRRFAEALSTVGRSYEQFRDVYDFGCGPGRMLRHLRSRAPHARLFASDIDQHSIAWLREHMPGVDARVNGWLPPLPFPTRSFDLVLGYSVFTHLSESYQDAWLAELRRVTRPGGIVLLTFHGESSWQWHREQSSMAAAEDLPELEARRRARGFLHWQEGVSPGFPDFYRTSFHLPGYIQRHWSRWFEVVRILESPGGAEHDVVVLRGPRAAGAAQRALRQLRRRSHGRSRERRRSGSLLPRLRRTRIPSTARPTSSSPASELPLPPEELAVRVSGTPDLELFDSGGAHHVEDLGAALATLGRRYEDFGEIYDFGCGCGRLLRHLVGMGLGARLSGSDIDAPAIEWVNAHLPAVDARVNGWLPPLPFASRSFDLVIGFSVFTHLDERFQDAWLGELYRVTKPGAILTLTVHGEASWRWHREETVMSSLENLDELDAERRRAGFLYWADDGWEAHFPDYYHTSFHLPWYIAERWSEWFRVEAVLGGAARPNHDIVVLRKPRLPRSRRPRLPRRTRLAGRADSRVPPRD